MKDIKHTAGIIGIAVFFSICVAMFLKFICAGVNNCACNFMSEFECWLERYQTLLTGILALSVGYATIQMMNRQITQPIKIQNQVIKTTVMQAVDRYYEDLKKEYPQKINKIKPNSFYKNKVDVHISEYIKNAEKYATLNQDGIDIIQKIYKEMQKCKNELYVFIDRSYTSNSPAEFNKVQNFIKECHSREMDLAKNITIEP